MPTHLLKVFTTNENHPEQEIEEDITTLLQNSLPIKLLSPKEIKEEIGTCHMNVFCPNASSPLSAYKIVLFFSSFCTSSFLIRM
jgi:hypothetical protein